MPTTSVWNSFLDCFSCCGHREDANHDQYLQPLNLMQPQVPAATGGCVRRQRRTPCRRLSTAACGLRVIPCCLPAVSELVEQSSAARERVWRNLGSLEPFALGQSPSSSSAMAGPKWPAMRQNFRVIHRPSGNVMIVSDGLSDPFDDIHEGGWVPPLRWAPSGNESQLKTVAQEANVLHQQNQSRVMVSSVLWPPMGQWHYKVFFVPQERTTSMALAWSSSLRPRPTRSAPR